MFFPNCDSFLKQLYISITILHLKHVINIYELKHRRQHYLTLKTQFSVYLVRSSISFSSGVYFLRKTYVPNLCVSIVNVS